jgi:hypothetical protein
MRGFEGESVARVSLFLQGGLSVVSVIPGRATWRGPGIHNHESGVWIPGSCFARPGMTTFICRSPKPR